ncbi:MAG: PHP domain-containing protein [Oscillospiraceae bacterium]|jgi:predicted metal-dependent phosphoesterase TrpH|nr:PHP domain-containing protein [Oscillospiraceae bacterium]
MIKADLHTHSTYSDGSLNIKSLFKSAKLSGLGAIALSDHDTMAGIPIARKEADKAGIKLIPAVEISAEDPGNSRKVHILAYFIQDSDLIEKVCRPWLEKRRQNCLNALEDIRRMGYPIDADDVLQYTESGVIYKQHIMRALMDRGFTLSVYGELYNRLFIKDGGERYKSSYMSAFEAIELVLQAGGLPVLAHPYIYDSMGLLPALVKSGLRGIECFHPSQNAERIKTVIEAAGKYGLFLTGGSDFHGFYSSRGAALGSVEFFLPEKGWLF